MKIKAVRANNHKKAFEVTTSKGIYPMPYSRVDPMPTQKDPLSRVYVDSELGNEGITYVLESGIQGAVHIDSFLEYNEDPSYMRDLLLYELTMKARECMETAALSKREIIRRSGTSPAQFYRLLDPTNTTKSVDKMLVLLSAMDYEVEFTVKPATPRS